MKRLVLLAALVASPAVAAPSFDCNKARSKAEKTICASPEASTLDSAVADVTLMAALERGTPIMKEVRWPWFPPG